MPSSEIARICTTVATIQFLCNIAGNWLVFNNGPYRKAVERLERTTKAKDLASRDAAEQHKGQKASKRAKRAKRVEEEHQTAVALVAGMHVLPGLLTNVVFFILLRIFGAEMKGKILGVLPFSPFSLLRRLSSRGLDFNPNGTFDGSTPSVIGVEQACSFMFVSQRGRESAIALFMVHHQL
jgi:hypothetical protein